MTTNVRGMGGALALFGAMLAGCSSESSPASTSDAGSDVADAASDAPAGCKKLTVSGLFRDPEFGQPAQKYSAIVGTPSPALGTDVPDEFQLQLYEFNGAQAPGTFDLSAGRETNFSTCAHCVMLFEDMDAEGNAKRQFFQTSGTLTLTVNPTPTTGAVKGKLEKLRLVEVTVDYAGKTYVSTPVPGGECFELDALDVDTTSAGDAGTP